MNNNPTRRTRRASLKSYGYFKTKKNFSFKRMTEIRKENLERGRKMFYDTQEAMDKSLTIQLESIEENRITYWKEVGYEDTEIQKLREANLILMVKNKETWNEDKKVARRLMKEALFSKNNRNTNL